MFRKTHIDMAAIRTTSKTALKLSCLQACNNDIAQAERLYHYIADGLSTLPDAEPVPPTTLERVKMGADDVLAWIGGHRDEIAQGIALLKGISQRVTATTQLPPIPKI